MAHLKLVADVIIPFIVLDFVHLFLFLCFLHFLHVNDVFTSIFDVPFLKILIILLRLKNTMM